MEQMGITAPEPDMGQPAMKCLSTAENVQGQLRACLESMERWRPKRDQAKAREWSVAITELEKVYAYFTQFVVQA